MEKFPRETPGEIPDGITDETVAGMLYFIDELSLAITVWPRNLKGNEKH